MQEKVNYKIIDDEHRARELLTGLSAFCSLTLDLETTGLDPRKDQILAAVLSSNVDECVYFLEGEALKSLPLLNRFNTFILQNFKFDFKFLVIKGYLTVENVLSKQIMDTMLLDHLVDENRGHGLDEQVKRNFKDNYKERFWSIYKEYSDAPKKEQVEYACKDVYYTYKNYILLINKFLPLHLIDHAHNLAKELWITETLGIGLDLEYLVALGIDLKNKEIALINDMRSSVAGYCAAIEMELYAKELAKYKTDKGRSGVTPPQFSFSSSKQVMSLLYEKLRLPVQTNLKTKKPSVDDASLENLIGKHPIIEKIQECRVYTKMHSSFVEGVAQRAAGSTIYPEFNVNGTVTGRISHSNPNMGQMPAKGEWAKIRGIFVPLVKDNILVSADYSQLEVSIAAHFSLDKNLLKVVLEGASLHDITAEALGVSRSTAKTINFAIQYGAGQFKIRSILGCSDKEAEAALNKYWKAYSGLKEFIDRCHEKLVVDKAITNPFGRVRHFDDLDFDNPKEVSRAKRQVFNSLVQGTGADLTSISFYRTCQRMRENGLGRGWFTVHDEILLECPKQHYEEVKGIITEEMLGAGKVLKLRVPLAIEVSEPMERWKK